MLCYCLVLNRSIGTISVAKYGMNIIHLSRFMYVKYTRQMYKVKGEYPAIDFRQYTYVYKKDSTSFGLRNSKTIFHRFVLPRWSGQIWHLYNQWKLYKFGQFMYLQENWRYRLNGFPACRVLNQNCWVWLRKTITATAGIKGSHHRYLWYWGKPSLLPLVSRETITVTSGIEGNPHRYLWY